MATFVQDGHSVDYTPAQAVAAGQVVVQGDLVGVARTPIAANALGSLAVEGVFDFPKATGGGTALAAGASVYWDTGNSRATATSVGNKSLGKVIRAALDGDAVVCVRLESMASVANNPLTAAIADPGNAGAIPVTASGHCDIVTAAAETRTLAAPTFAGQQILLTFKAKAVGDPTITVADPPFDGTNNTIVMTAAGQSVLLMASAVGAGFAWNLAFNNGATLSHV